MSFLISKKFNTKYKKDSIIPMISFFSKIGVFLGTCILIVSCSALNGFQFELNNRILSVLPHGEIIPINQPFKNWKKIKNLLQSFTNVTFVMPYVSTTALIDHPQGIKGIQLRGLDFSDIYAFKKLKKFINIKILHQMNENKNQIILGNGIAKSLSIKIGDQINIFACKNYNSLTLQYKYINLKVISIFKIDGNIDNTLALVSMKNLQKCFGMKSAISGLEIFVKNPLNDTKIFKTIHSKLPNTYIVKNWITEYDYIYHDIKLIKTIIYFTMTLIFISSCLSISSINFLEISKKTNSFAIFKTLGMNNRTIMIIFLIHGIKSILKIGFLSLFLSTILLLNIKNCIYYIEKFFGKKLLSSIVYFIDFIPIFLSFVDVISIFCILFLIGFVTSYFPAYYIKSIEPAKILKKY
ncbi:MAG: FtsX-like permease family protein [Buchnera aphidicola (Nurudea yanoniella)]